MSCICSSVQPLAPALPPIADTLPGYEVIGCYGLVAPARTPAEIITRLNAGIVRALRSADVQARMVTLGAELSPPAGASEFGAYLVARIEQSRQLIRESGAKPDERRPVVDSPHAGRDGPHNTEQAWKSG
jgi:tripartite-type tricarboxylate transporter receptor subunit TctC